jgi:Putative MetA-pathway of phenol degradation
VTTTKRFGKWELGPVGIYSTDLNKPISEYKKQSQVQLGGLVAYYFKAAVVQAYVTRNVYDKNYGGPITSGTLRLVVPLDDGPPVAIAQ